MPPSLAPKPPKKLIRAVSGFLIPRNNNPKRNSLSK
jgi:hypothetical protein